MPLVKIHNKELSKVASNRMQKIKLKLMIYDLVVEYLPGKKMLIADLLSRDYLDEKFKDEINIPGVIHCIQKLKSKTIKDENIVKANKNDPIISQIINYYNTGWPASKKSIPENLRHYWKLKDDIAVNDNIAYYNDRIIVPKQLRAEFLKLLHKSHNGIVKSKLRAKRLFYWPGLNNEIENHILRCRICEKYRSSNIKEPLIPHPVPELPFQKIAIDILTYKGVDYLALIDYYSKWLEISKLKYKNAQEIIKILKFIFSTHGVPQIIIADNVPFGSYEFQKFAENWNITVVNSSPNYPRSNGMAEKGVHIAKTIIKKSLEEGKDINEFLLEYRCTPIPALSKSPSEILMSRLLRTTVPIAKKQLKPKVSGNIQYKIKNNQVKYKQQYDRTARIKKHFNPRQNVVIQKNKIWVPGQIVSKLEEPRSYMVKDENEQILRRNSVHLKKSYNEPNSNKRLIEDEFEDELNVTNVTNVPNDNYNDHLVNNSNENILVTSSTPKTPVKTRSGRVVIKPKRYPNDI